MRGNMCCGVVGTDLVLRLGDEGVAAALKSMLYLPSEGYADDWVR